MAKIEVMKELCKSCGFCVKYCPKHIIAVGEEVNSKGYEYVKLIDEIQCIGCAICGKMCPDGAINVYK